MGRCPHFYCGVDWSAFILSSGWLQETLLSFRGRDNYPIKLANKGVPVRVVPTLAGHSSMQTTQRYIDLNEGMLVQAVELA